MSIRESFDWVALPAGIAPPLAGDRPNRCRLSVFVAPQVTLVGEPTRILRLEELTDLVDWPDALAGMELSVEIDGAAAVPATRVGPGPNSQLWRRLFPPHTAVEPFVPDDPTINTVVQYAAIDVLDVIETGYSSAALLEPPMIDHFDPAYWEPDHWIPEWSGSQPDQGIPGETGVPGVIGEENIPGREWVGEERGLVDQWSLRNLIPPVYQAVAQPDNSWLFGAGTGGANLLTRAAFVSGRRVEVPLGEDLSMPSQRALEMARFADSMRLTWQPEDVAMPEETAEERTAALIDSYDLHRIVAALGDHPALLRSLGLVLDLEIPVRLPPSGQIRVVVSRPAGGSGTVEHADRNPWVKFTTRAPNGFSATSASDATTPPGLEDLGQYHVIQLDIEGAAAQLLERAAEEVTGAESAAPPRELPPLRTAGLRLVESGAADRLIDRAEHTNELRLLADDPAVEDSLDADDVRRGFRLDVLDQTTGKWYPLHARQVRYRTADGTVLGSVTDEGSFTGSFTGRPLAPGETLDPGDLISVDESLVTWDGWSLAAPRPGAVVSADPFDADEVHRTEAGTSIIGRPQNDPLTSTGLGIDTAVLPGSLPKLRFGRSYRMRLRSVDLAGNALTVEQADEAVSEDARGAVTDEVVFRRFERVPPPVPAFAVPADKAPPRIGETERRLVVRSGLDEGDDTFGPEPGVDERLFFAPECSVQLAEWHGAFDDAIGAHGSAADRAAAYRRAARESGVLHPDATELPWLADPASAGACFSGLPGMAADDVLVVRWPESPAGPGPIRLRLEALDIDEIRRPDVDEHRGVVTAFLPPGGRAIGAVSSVLTDETVMALPAVWRQRLDVAALEIAKERLARHRHGMVTPDKPFELVHATQRPRQVPQPADSARLLERSPEDTHIRVMVPWTVHGPTTGTVELVAEWAVPRDEPIQLPSPVASPAPEAIRWGPAMTPVATTMGRPLLVPPVAVTGPFNVAVFVDDGPGTVVLGNLGDDMGEDPIDPAGATLDLDTTAHVTLRLTAIATSRFAEFFGPEFGPAEAAADASARASRLTVASQPVTIDVPSTRQPPAPTVLEVMPLVVRDRADGLVRRQGGWLRVWLARPWFVSGEGELPAIVAAWDAQPAHPLLADGYQVSTLVGPDPARQLPIFGGVRPHDLGGFPAAWAKVRLTEMRIAEASGIRRTIGVSDRGISWDPDQQAWYTDLRVDVPDLYFPFARLALARHQPTSIRGSSWAADEFRVSPVITLDPIQVLPDRELRHTEDTNSVTVSLSGQSYDTAFQPVNLGTAEAPNWVMQELPGGAPSAARVVAQRRVRTGGDELLAWEDLFEQAMLNAPDALPGALVARLTLPFDPTDPPGEFRLLVLEEDFAHGPRVFQHPEGTRGRVTFAEVIPLRRAVARAG
ncbi:hypothetical protein [Phytoactinopolyspora limicola]|uniref:hypothetical protein n=1 Tax=Phytoactinopolyspora limicola TaxID=2715536 RepID=UPI00140AAAAA|nr:hypothetical protein [Phytoactinopolyspora limicola]